MAEHTPKTSEVREAWAKRNALYRSTSLAALGVPAHIAENDALYSADDYAAFDRWIAEHDREVAEKAWEEGREAGVENQVNWDGYYGWEPGSMPSENPYRGGGVS